MSDRIYQVAPGLQLVDLGDDPHTRNLGVPHLHFPLGLCESERRIIRARHTFILAAMEKRTKAKITFAELADINQAFSP